MTGVTVTHATHTKGGVRGELLVRTSQENSRMPCELAQSVSERTCATSDDRASSTVVASAPAPADAPAATCR